MKKVFLIFALMFICCSNAQTYEKTTSKGFDVETGADTKTTILIDGKAFNLFQTTKGSLFVKCISERTKNAYAVWIGTPTETRHEGKAVYKTKSGKACIYKLSKSGNPYAVYLKETK